MEGGLSLQMGTDFTSLIILIIGCLVGGIASTTVGTSGGFTFAVMATVFPISAVVPVHATVEAFASLARSYLLYKYINWQFLLSFAAGGAVGLVLAAPFIGVFPELGLQLVLGLFIVATTWIPLGKIVSQGAKYAVLSGGFTSFLTVFIGATGPLVAVLTSKRFDAHATVIATHAACMTGQHLGKIVIFALAGWTLTSFAIEIGSMIAATVIGTWIGRHVILSGPENVIKLIFKITVTLLGVNLVISAIGQLLV